MVDHDDVVVVGEIPFIDHERCGTVLGEVGRQERALADLVPPGTVLAAHRVPLEEHGLLVPQFDALDVDRIATYGDPIPSSTHRTL